MSQLEFYTSFLHTYANTGDEILDLIDKILEGEVVWFDPDTFWPSLTRIPPRVSDTLYTNISEVV